MPRTQAQREAHNAQARAQRARKRKQKIINEYGDEVAFVVHNTVASAIKKVIQDAKARDRTRKWALEHKAQKKETDRKYYEHAKEKAFKEGTSYKSYKAKRAAVTLQKPRYDKKNRIKERKDTNECFLIRQRLSGRLAEFLKLKNGKKATGTMMLVGCAQNELINHLKEQLAQGETLREMASDHIFPVTLYGISESDQKRLMHFSNLQPLNTHENVNKSNRLPTKAMAAKVARWAWPDGITEDMLPDIYDGWSTPLRM